MFKQSKNGTNRVIDPNAPDNLNRIVMGTSVIGDIVAESNLRIDGKVEGNISANGKVVIGASGSVTGNINADSADVEGSVNGNLVVKDLLIFRSTAKHKGEIRPGTLVIENGAEFNGTCAMSEPSPVKAKEDKVPKEGDVVI